MEQYPEILEQKVKDGVEVKLLFATISAVWQPWLGTIPNVIEKDGIDSCNCCDPPVSG